jgi:hypothetical protein
MKDARPVTKITEDIAAHLANHPPYVSIDKILRTFLEEIGEVS